MQDQRMDESLSARLAHSYRAVARDECLSRVPSTLSSHEVATKSSPRAAHGGRVHHLGQEAGATSHTQVGTTDHRPENALEQLCTKGIVELLVREGNGRTPTLNRIVDEDCIERLSSQCVAIVDVQKPPTGSDHEVLMMPVTQAGNKRQHSGCGCSEGEACERPVEFAAGVMLLEELKKGTSCGGCQKPSAQAGWSFAPLAHIAECARAIDSLDNRCAGPRHGNDISDAHVLQFELLALKQLAQFFVLPHQALEQPNRLTYLLLMVHAPVPLQQQPGCFRAGGVRSAGAARCPATCRSPLHLHGRAASIILATTTDHHRGADTRGLARLPLKS
mmetsp:Transcript_88635/g.190317  ORF Transcript_88635/g.190317 Transcript_88635/m.190317 type:complete len:333 (-) Transcript_88635:168-1166(-)